MEVVNQVKDVGKGNAAYLENNVWRGKNREYDWEAGSYKKGVFKPWQHWHQIPAMKQWATE